MSHRSEVARRATAAVTCVVLVVVMVGLVCWALLVPPLPGSRVEPVALPVASEEQTYACPAAPANTLGAVAPGPVDATTTVVRLGNGSASVNDVAMPSGGLERTDADGGLVRVVPATASEEATAVGTVVAAAPTGDLRSLAAAPCLTGSAMSWIVGGSAAVGSSAQLRLTNPGLTAVTAQVTMYGSTGTLPLSRGGQLAVPAGETVSLLLEGAGAQDERMAVSVETDGGVVIASLASQTLDGETPAGSDLLTPGSGTGRDLLVPGVVLPGRAGAEDGGQDREAPEAEAAPENADEATEQSDAADASGSDAGESGGSSGQDAPEPQAGVGEDGGRTDAAASASVVRVVNPGQAQASVSVSLLGADGEEELGGAQQVAVDPQTVSDISLAGVSGGTYGVRVVSDQPVAAAVRVVRVGAEFPAGSGVSVRDVAWTQAEAASDLGSGAVAVPTGFVAGTQSRHAVLALTNGGEDLLQVSLVAVRGDGEEADWQQSLDLAPGSSVSVDLTEADLPEGTRALRVLAPDGAQVVGAMVLTQDVTAGSSDGTDEPSATTQVEGQLISVVPVTGDAARSAARSVILH